MAKYQLIFTENAQRYLKRLDKVTRQRIARKLLFYLDQDDPLMYSRPLIHSSIGSYRFRVGHYRIVFEINNDNLEVINIKHRKDVYKSK